MSHFDTSKLRQLCGQVHVGSQALHCELLQLAIEYKTAVAKRYRLLRADDIATRIHEPKMYCSIKIDGQFSYLCKDGDELFVFNYSGRVITGLAALADARKALAGVEQAILACELYLPDENGRSRVYDVTSALGKDAHRIDELRLAVFDVLQWNREDKQQLAYSQRDDILLEYLPAAGAFHRVESRLVDRDKINDLYTEWVVKGGHEGVVARSADQTAYKIKPRHNLDAVVLGFTERADEAGKLSTLLTGLMRPDGSLQVLTRIGTGFSEQQRSEMFALLKPLEVPSLYKETDGNHILFTMVEPTVVIELAFHDLLSEDSFGAPASKAVLQYLGREQGYDVRMPEPFVILLAPVFERIRDDKQANATDLRLSRLQPYVELTNLESGARDRSAAASELLARDVYVKQSRGATSVRKFLSWKSNKEEDPSFPAYGFCYVDYSPTRKAPLKRVLRVSNSRQRIEEIHQSYLASEVKTGWQPAGVTG